MGDMNVGNPNRVFFFFASSSVDDGSSSASDAMGAQAPGDSPVDSLGKSPDGDAFAAAGAEGAGMLGNEDSGTAGFNSVGANK